MATKDPTGDSAAVVLEFPSAHKLLLRARITDCLAGLEDDLEFVGGSHPHLARARGEAAAYRQLLLGLAGEEVIPEPFVVEVAGDLARTIDQANDYERVILEHSVLHCLLAQLDPRKASVA